MDLENEEELTEDCPQIGLDFCDWFRNDNGFLECSGCGRTADDDYIYNLNGDRAMSQLIEELEARSLQLQKEINEAPRWGAAVGARYEELLGVNRRLEAARASQPQPKKQKRRRWVSEEPSDA